MTTLDRSDLRRGLAQHRATGDRYIVEYCSVWDDNDECVGSQIIAAVGPLAASDLPPNDAEPEVWFDWIDNACNLSSEDAEWLQAEEDAGQLSYPRGVR